MEASHAVAVALEIDQDRATPLSSRLAEMGTLAACLLRAGWSRVSVEAGPDEDHQGREIVTIRLAAFERTVWDEGGLIRFEYDPHGTDRLGGAARQSRADFRVWWEKTFGACQ